MTSTELRKQISLFLPVSEWLAIRHEAARRKIPMTELCREWLRPKLDRLREQDMARRQDCLIPTGEPTLSAHRYRRLRNSAEFKSAQ